VVDPAGSTTSPGSSRSIHKHEIHVSCM